jgi:hypothetical protein
VTPTKIGPSRWGVYNERLPQLREPGPSLGRWCLLCVCADRQRGEAIRPTCDQAVIRPELRGSSSRAHTRTRVKPRSVLSHAVAPKARVRRQPKPAAMIARPPPRTGRRSPLYTRVVWLNRFVSRVYGVEEAQVSPRVSETTLWETGRMDEGGTANPQRATGRNDSPTTSGTKPNSLGDHHRGDSGRHIGN